MKQLVESIIRELVGKLQEEKAAKEPRVLYLFNDSTAHEAYADHFILLRKNGIHYDRMFLDGVTSAWLGMHKVESSGSGRVIAQDDSAPAPIEIPLAYDGLVIPEISLDDAGRIALGMKGTVVSELAFAALVTGKFVVVGDDSPGLTRADRRTLKALELPEPYRKLFRYYKSEMQMYGVYFAPSKELATWVADRFGMKAGEEKDDARDPAGFETGTGIERFEGKLLTAEWVRERTRSGRIACIEAGKGTIVSPLAKDMLREQGIEVRMTDGG
ncbi:hypothetical protein [Paenibacillus montanisoli]|nr:hypothetical protein [Paenibacillus montanisoli]